MPDFTKFFFGSITSESEDTKIEKPKRPKNKDFIHPMKRENSRLKNELDTLKGMQTKTNESQEDEEVEEDVYA